MISQHAHHDFAIFAISLGSALRRSRRCRRMHNAPAACSGQQPRSYEQQLAIEEEATYLTSAISGDGSISVKGGGDDGAV